MIKNVLFLSRINSRVVRVGIFIKLVVSSLISTQASVTAIFETIKIKDNICLNFFALMWYCNVGMYCPVEEIVTCDNSEPTVSVLYKRAKRITLLLKDNKGSCMFVFVD